MKKLLLASACALACAAVSAPARADGLAGTAQGTFGNIAGAASWSVDGAVSVPLDWNGLSVEGNLGDRGASFLHVFDGGGSVVWSGMDVRLAASVLYNRLSGFGGSADETQFGGGGEWYVLPPPTATASWVAASVAGKAADMWVALSNGTLTRISRWRTVYDTSISSANETDFGAHAEWLPMEDLPISVGATYTHINLSAGALAQATRTHGGSASSSI